MENLKNEERLEMLKFLKSLNADVLGDFEISKCAQEMYDAQRGTTSSFLPLSVKEVWFKKKYPLSRVECKVTYPSEESIETQEKVEKIEVYARAIVCVNGIETEIGNSFATMYADDPAVKDTPVEKGRRYDAMKALCIGTARSKALYNAGFGREFYGEENDLQLLRTLEEEKATTAPSSTFDAALDVLSKEEASTEVGSSAGFVPVADTTFDTKSFVEEVSLKEEKPEKTTGKKGFQSTLDGYFEEVLGLVPGEKGLVASKKPCMLDEVRAQSSILEKAEEKSSVAEEARKHLKKCEKRLEVINTWIAKRGAIKMDELYRSEDRIPLTIDKLIEMAQESKPVEEVVDKEEKTVPTTAPLDDRDFMDSLSDADFDAAEDYSEATESYLDIGYDEPVQTSMFESTDYRKVRCTSEKGDFLGKTYGEIISENPDVLSYLLDENTPDDEANAIISLAKELSNEDMRFSELYDAVMRKEAIRKQAFDDDGVGDFS